MSPSPGTRCRRCPSQPRLQPEELPPAAARLLRQWACDMYFWPHPPYIHKVASRSRAGFLLVPCLFFCTPVTQSRSVLFWQAWFVLRSSFALRLQPKTCTYLVTLHISSFIVGLAWRKEKKMKRFFAPIPIPYQPYFLGEGDQHLYCMLGPANEE